MNPIIQAISGRSNNGILDKINGINQMINGNPEAVYQQMMQSNPQFRQFVESNQGKSPEQIAQENGIDFNLLNQFRK